MNANLDMMQVLEYTYEAASKKKNYKTRIYIKYYSIFIFI